MNTSRANNLRALVKNPILIKKKENLLYLLGRSFMHGYLLVKPINTDRKRINTDVVFLGDGLEKVEGIKSDFLKNVGKYIGRGQTLEVFADFNYGEVKYIKFKNPKLKVKVVIKREPADRVRTIKEPGEIALIRKSMQIVEQVFKQVRKEIKKPGMTEIRLADFIKSAGLKLGAEDISFPPIVAAGAHAAVPHHVPDGTRLKPNQSIIIDCGFKYKNYCSDFTRTVFLKSAPKKLAEAYNQVEKAYLESMKFIETSMKLRASASERSNPIFGNQIASSSRYDNAQFATLRNFPIVRGDQVYQKSVEVLAEKRLDKYFIHSLGHGTGLEIHELPNLSPNSKDILQNSMVFSIEPGVYLPKQGGIRIEDLVYLEGGKVKKFINVSTELKDNIL